MKIESFGGYKGYAINLLLEVLTSGGQYCWIPFECIGSVIIHLPRQPRDLLWRAAHVDMLDGQEADFFLPVIYPILGESEALQLGRATEWRGGENSPARGLGQRMFMIDDNVITMMELQEIQITKKQIDE